MTRALQPLNGLQRDGSLRRVRQPVNTIDPYKSLLKPLYNYDIESAMKAKKVMRATLKSLATVADNEDERTGSKISGVSRGTHSAHRT